MDQYEAIRDGVANTTATNTDPNVALLLAVIFLDGAQTILVLPIVYGDEAFAKSSSLGWLWELPGALEDTTALVSWEDLQNIQCMHHAHVRRHH